MVRQIDDRIEFSTLADCRVAYDDQGEGRLFGTTSLTNVEGGTIALARHHLEADPELTPSSLRDLLLPRLRANRKLMNRAGGYWVLGTEPDAADHLDVMTVPPHCSESCPNCGVAVDSPVHMMVGADTTRGLGMSCS